MKYKIKLMRLPIKSKAYRNAKFCIVDKTVELILENDKEVLLNGKVFKVSDVGELAEAIVTGHWDKPVFFMNEQKFPIRYKLYSVESTNKQFIRPNPVGYTRRQVADIFMRELDELIKYNDFIYVDDVINTMSKELKVKKSLLQDIFDKAN